MFEVVSCCDKGSEKMISAKSLAFTDREAVKEFLLQEGGVPDHPWLHEQVLFVWKVAFCMQDKQLVELGPEQVKQEESQEKMLLYVIPPQVSDTLKKPSLQVRLLDFNKQLLSKGPLQFKHDV